MKVSFQVINHQTSRKIGVVEADASQVMAYMQRKDDSVRAGVVLTDSQRRQLGLNADHIIRFYRA